MEEIAGVLGTAARAPRLPLGPELTQEARAGGPAGAAPTLNGLTETSDPRPKPRAAPCANPISLEVGSCAPIHCLGVAGLQILQSISPAPPFLLGAGAKFSLSTPSPSWLSAP